MKIAFKPMETTIPNLYDQIAIEMKLPVTDDVRYDCTKVNVSKDIMDAIFSYYKKHGLDEGSLSMTWVCYGPKAVDELGESTVELEEGWYTRNDSTGDD